MFSYALAVAALFLFLLSTRQIGLRSRILTWTGGAVALSAAAYNAFDDPLGMLVALTDASVRLSVLLQNWHVVSGSLGIVLEVSIVLGVVVGALALLALTPGDTIERLTRPLGLLLLGGIFGAASALVIVASGYGGYHEPAVYSGRLNNNLRVIDGDGLAFDDVELRLAGFDAPERQQQCIGGVRSCGAAAAAQLRVLLGNELVICRRPAWSPSRDGRARPTQTFGRYLVQCYVGEGETAFDLASRMAEFGYGVDFRASEYRDAVARARQQEVGLWAGCMLPPRLWRKGGVEREEFEASEEGRRRHGEGRC